MEIASALNLIAQPQTEEPAAGLGCFHIFFLSGVRHCNITASQPFCDRVWEERASRTQEARYSPGPLSRVGQGTPQMTSGTRLGLPGEPLRAGTLNQNASSVPFSTSPKM